jgi:hypothetical protein
MMELTHGAPTGRYYAALYIDIADFYGVSDMAAQNLRIFWSTTTT